MTSILKLLRAVCLAAALGASAASATTVSINYSDMWGTASEPGWGITISQQGNILLGTLFIYDQGSLARWYTVTLLPDSIGPSGAIKYSGTLFETTGPPFSQPFNPALVKFRQVGQLSIEFGDAVSALMNYTIDGAGAVKQLTRFTFAANPIVGTYLGATSDITYDCTNPANNGLVTNDTGPFTITQDASGVMMKFPICTVTDGVYTQHGQISQVDAIYNCPGGASGEIKFNVLQAEQGGIVGTYTGRDKSCYFRGNIGGARIAK